ncbi:MAG: PhzF family phenazine biosynthesis protein [Terriglobales bacterium]
MPATPRRFQYVQLDVFTSRPLEGNALAVFTDARGLSDREMQALARETNLCETTFVLPRDAATERERGHRVRIFTVQEELPFAGHPTLGTATVLHGASGASVVELDLNVGKIAVSFTDGSEGAAFGEMRQRDPELGLRHSREDVARVTGLKIDEIADDVPIQTVSTGLAFTIVPVRTLASMRALHPDLKAASQYLEGSQGKFFYFVSRETEDKSARLHARMIFYNGDDPATGSAAGCTAAWMVAHGVVKPEERALIEQGIETRRPSRIFVRAGRDGDRIVNVRVGGNSVEVIRGEMFL